MNMIKQMLRSRQVVVGGILALGFILIALFAPIISPAPVPQTALERDRYRGEGYNLVVENARARIREPQPPSPGIWFGTDEAQFDIFHTVVWGSRSALYFGLIVTFATALLGIIIGAFSGYIGGWVQTVTLQISDAFLSVPLVTGVWVTIIVMNVWGYTNVPEFMALLQKWAITPTMLAFIFFTWMPYARVMNAVVLQLKNMSFIQASEALGASTWRVVILHLIPNALSPMIVLIARDIGGTVTFASALQAIGLGSASEWGSLLAQNRDWILGISGNVLLYWWVYVPITLAFILFGIAWNLLGDGLNGILNPKTT